MMKNPKNQNKKESKDMKQLENYEDLINNSKLNYFSSVNPNQFIKSLSSPRFLGSYHMNRSVTNTFSHINDLLKGNLEIKYTKSLRNIIFNPVTVTLIIFAVLFNFLWIFYSLI